MFRRRRQVARMGTRAVRGAARTVGRVATAAYRAAKRYKPSTGMRMTAKAAAAGTIGRVAYKQARTALRSIGMTYAGGNDYSKSKGRVGRKQKLTVPRLNKLIQAGMNTQVYRFQNITNFDTNVGAFALANWQLTTNQVMMPFHVYQLSSFNNRSAYTPAKFFVWDNLTATASVIRGNLPTQTPSGGVDGSGNWQLELKGGVNPLTTFPNATKFMHNWTDVRILFYGARVRTTRFDVMFVRVKDNYANLFHGAATNTELKELCQFIERPSIFNPIQSLDGSHINKKLQIVKKFTYYISAAQTTDVDTSVGKTKEARIFLRHDKLYGTEFKHWSEDAEGTVLPHAQEDGLDYEQDTNNHNVPWYSSQLFMIVRAFAPQRVTGKTSYLGTADANIDPSYDIIIRNSVSTPA